MNKPSFEEFNFKVLRGRRVLVVSGDWPWYPDYAARIDVCDRIESLNSLGLVVDVVATCGSQEGIMKFSSLSTKVDTCYAVQRKSGFLAMLGVWNPGQISSRKRLSEVNFTNFYDFVILEGHYVGSILDNPNLKADNILIRVNNDERFYFLSLAISKLSLKSFYYTIEALRFGHYWKSLMRRVPTWMFSSAKEYEQSSKLAHSIGVRSIFLPPKVCLPQNLNINNKKSNSAVLFLGTLLVPNNLNAVRWYLENVHQKLLDIPGYHFYVAGNNGNNGHGGAIGKLLKNISCVTLVPNPQNTDLLYEQSAVFVNPMRNGAGIKLKTVHALAAGLPVVATEVGAEGTLMRHAKDIYITNDAILFAKYVRELLTEKTRRMDMIESAQSQLFIKYKQEEILGNLLVDLLNNECNKTDA